MLMKKWSESTDEREGEGNHQIEINNNKIPMVPKWDELDTGRVHQYY